MKCPTCEGCGRVPTSLFDAVSPGPIIAPHGRPCVACNGTGKRVPAQSLDVDAIEARANAATAGPWRACGHDRGGCQCGLVWALSVDALIARCTPDEDAPTANEEGRKRDADFIAAARIDVPALVAEVRRLRTALKQATCSHPASIDTMPSFCAMCGKEMKA